MDLQQLINDLINQYKEAKEATYICQIFSFHQSYIKDQNWLNSAYSFVTSLSNEYPIIKNYIEKYQNDKNGLIDFQTVDDYLFIAAMCLVTELYINSHKEK